MEKRHHHLSSLRCSKIGPISQPTPGRVMTFLILAVFDLLIIKPYDFPNVLRRNYKFLKCLDDFISIFAVGDYFANDLAFVRFV